MLPLNSHIWVGASAGTGKTTILTNRVLQLLLSGSHPGTIVCLTYTNAAASEMKERIMDRLGRWVIMEDAELTADISNITEHKSSDVLKRSRSLFFEVSENPDSLHIQTIHSFCQSILRRFPIEASVSPYFTVVDEERSGATIEMAFESLLFEVQQGKRPELQASIQEIISHITDYSFREFVKNAINDNGRWREWLDQAGGISSCNKRLQGLLELSNPQDMSFLRKQESSSGLGALEDPSLRWDDKNEALSTARKQSLQQLIPHFTGSKKAPLQHIASEIEALLSLVEITDKDMDEYCNAWLTQAGKVRSVVLKFADENDPLSGPIEDELAQLFEHKYNQAHLASYQLTSHLYTILSATFKEYEALCDQYGYLDYHSLLYKTREFLTSQESSLGWVMFKLDGGIDHILVDEAQDTNPLQWDIIKSLTQEYFSGKGQKEKPRTLFIVGDEKQSIFGFQGADLGYYRSIKEWLIRSATNAGQDFHEESLVKSYRSTTGVINAVNQITDELGWNSKHIANRQDAEGITQLWPLATKQEQGDKIVPADTMLAQQIVNNIENWLLEKKHIASTGKAIEPGDVMILVRRRSALSEQLASELRKRSIAVQGVERLVLSDSLAVQDILALIGWALLPRDDYSLACVLRSPIGNISEEQLYDLSHDRGEVSLWQQLQETSDPQLKELSTFLANCQQALEGHTIHAFIFSLLFEHGLANQFIKRMGQDVIITLHALLEKAKQFEQTHARNYQFFIEFIQQQQQAITNKEASENCVRIMTVHGSKGLEAPIVIMADATNQTRSISGFEWIGQLEEQIPCWLPPKASRKYSLDAHIEQSQQTSEEEDKRLLYVAMTRARDELYVTGLEEKESQKVSWYQLLAKHLAVAAKIETKTSQALDEAKLGT